MFLVGDIGNTDTKICLVNSRKKIIIKINFSSKNITNTQLKNWGCKYTRVENKIKPVYDLFIDDKAKWIEEI